jgi:hypothetical protein
MRPIFLGASLLRSPAPGGICYAIRSCEYVQDDPASGVTRLAGSSTCQPAASTQLNAVVDPRIIRQR